MSEEKVIRRSVATKIVLIIIAAGAIGVLFMSGIYVRYVDDHHYTDENYATLLQENYRLNNILALETSAVLLNNQTVSQAAGLYTSWNLNADYCGFVEVWVNTSNASSNYVRLTYHSNVDFDQKVVLNAGDSAKFPVVRGFYQIMVGNGNAVDGATQTVTIGYYY